MKGFIKSKPALTLVTLALLAAALVASLAVNTRLRASAADSIPSGETILGKSTIEPVYDDTNGSITYVMTPNNAPNPVHSNPNSWAPFYVPVYPVGSTVGTLLCAHTPKDNCPDHGPGIAGAAATIVPSVYGDGVLGHDHLMAPPGSGGDFNIAWEPILVLFTTKDAANTHLTTLAQINAAVNGPNPTAIEVPLPQLTFHCEVVPAKVYALGTPVTPV